MVLNKYEADLEAIKKNFNESWEKILETITSEPRFKSIRDAIVWCKKIMENNVPDGKKNRALAMIYYYQHLVEDRTQEEDFNSYVIGWCIEMMQATALIADDIMDSSLTRHGKKCWYLREDVGSNAVNDVLMLENSVYFLLKKYFRQRSSYTGLLEIFHETSLFTSFGQCLDSKMCDRKCDFDEFTIDKYNVIVEYKTSYYSFYSPLALALTLAGVSDEKVYKCVEDISLKMGHLFQIQDDFLDCYGDPKVTGKIGTDIIDGKCTWLILQALEKATKDQISTLKKSYGSKLIEDELKVKSIFNELGLAKHFFIYETKEYNKISRDIDNLPNSIPKDPLYSFLDKIYQRQK